MDGPHETAGCLVVYSSEHITPVPTYNLPRRDINKPKGEIMKKMLMYTLSILLLAGLSAEAKKDQGKDKREQLEKEIKQAEGKLKADVDATKNMSEDKSKEAKEKAKSEKIKGKVKSEKAKGKSKSEEMKKATAEKKEAQKVAKESGEKMDKKQKSKWKFWKK